MSTWTIIFDQWKHFINTRRICFVNRWFLMGSYLFSWASPVSNGLSEGSIKKKKSRHGHDDELLLSPLSLRLTGSSLSLESMVDCDYVDDESRWAAKEIQERTMTDLIAKSRIGPVLELQVESAWVPAVHIKRGRWFNYQGGIDWSDARKRGIKLFFGTKPKYTWYVVYFAWEQ